MRTAILALALAGVTGYVVWTKCQPPPERLTAALAEAKQENKLVLLDFTGSDWCGWCMKLDEESLNKPEFINYAAKCLVTLVVDFPAHRELPSDLKAANAALKRKYNVTGFPTLLALSPDGKEVWRQTGYAPGGPLALIGPLHRNRMALGLPDPSDSSNPSNPSAVASITKPAPAPTPAAPPPVTLSPAAKHGLPADAPKLQGILYSKSSRSVTLGGRQCVEGDSVAGIRVVKIFQDRVVVESDGQLNELTMK